MTTIKCSHFKTEADVGSTCISKCAFSRRPGKNRQCPDLASFIESNEAECASILAKVTSSKPFREAFPSPTAQGIAAARAGTTVKVVAIKPAASPSGCSDYTDKPEDVEDAVPERERATTIPRVIEAPYVPAPVKEVAAAPTPAVDSYKPLSISALETFTPRPPKQVLAAEHAEPKKREKAIKNAFVIFVETAPGSGLFTLNDIDIRDLLTYTMAGRRVVAAPEATEF